MWGHRQQWISHKINIWHPGQLKKSKSWEPFWSYQLNSTANPAHSPHNWAKLTVLFSWLLQNGSQDFDFFNCMGADYSFNVKSIATFALAFFGYIISVLASVSSVYWYQGILPWIEPWAKNIYDVPRTNWYSIGTSTQWDQNIYKVRIN